MINLSELAVLKYWIKEREQIRLKREAGNPKPWSTDPIFQTYKFCNVRREDDRVTKWMSNNWRHERYWNEPNFVPAIIFARTINWPDTLGEIGFPITYQPEYILRVLDRVQGRGDKVYTGAYMITAGPEGVRKNLWVVQNSKSYFETPPIMYPKSLRLSWESIIAGEYPCVGPFIAGQVIADLKHTKILKDAEDWKTWACIGPGSTRGLNRLHRRKLNHTLTQEQGLKELREVQQELNTGLCLQDVQNCLCEFDKYRRVELGQGKPRSSYPGR